jgi:FkbM family methyltransferase
MVEHRSKAFTNAMNGLTAAGQTRFPRAQKEPQLHRHRLPADVTSQASAGQPDCLGGNTMRVLRSTRNGIEPEIVVRNIPSPIQESACQSSGTQNISTSMRRLLRKFLRNLGFQRRIAPDFVDVMKAYKIDVVFDIGANDGDYGREIRDRGYTGLIVSFEPNPNAFNRLEEQTKNDTNWKIYPFAIGNRCEERELNIADNDVFSSFKDLTAFGKNAVTQTKTTTKTRVITLEQFLFENPTYLRNIYLKIDTQGYEREVIQGAINILPESVT